MRWQTACASALAALAAPVGAGAALPAQRVPQNPFMAPNGRSNVHDDAYMSDAYARPGPRGRRPTALASFQAGICVTVTFDSRGRIVATCLGPQGPRLVMLDPVSLHTEATMPLPPPNALAGRDLLSAFGAGIYFYLDEHDRAVIATNNHQIWLVEETGGPLGPGFRLARTFDLSGAMASDDALLSVLPDWSGRLWFVTTGGVVGTVDPGSGRVQTLELKGQAIVNSFAVDESGGVFIVSDHAMYRFDATAVGRPRVSWRAAYDRGKERKPGQLSQGSGTTPTLLGRRYVAITDNADPRMHVVVYRRARRIRGRRLVCARPVFARGRSDTENSLIGYRNSLIVENNYGSSTIPSPRQGVASQPGLARVDIVTRRGRLRCRTVWTSRERAPSVVPKLSSATGLVYTYTKRPDPMGDRWYLTGLDFASGRTVFSTPTGTGFSFDNFYASVSIGRDGAAYVGLTQGLVRIADAG